MRQIRANQQAEYRSILNDQKMNQTRDPLIKVNNPGAGSVQGHHLSSGSP